MWLEPFSEALSIPVELFQETFVISHGQLRIDLLQCLESDTGRNQEGNTEIRVSGDVPDGQGDRGKQCHSRQEEGTWEGDPVENPTQITLSRGPRPDALDISSLLAEHLRLLMRIECNRHVKEGEDDDKKTVDSNVGEARRRDEMVRNEGPEGLPRNHVGQQHREVKDRTSEDDRNDTGLIYLQWDIGLVATIHLPTDYPPCKDHRDPTLAELHVDDGHDDCQSQNKYDGELEGAGLLINNSSA